MKVLLLYLFLFLAPSSSVDHQEKFYLICTGKYSKSYHKDYQKVSDYCRGLKACRAEIQRLPADEARRLRSDPCDYCYGH
jgi:hypothetical protein